MSSLRIRLSLALSSAIVALALATPARADAGAAESCTGQHAGAPCATTVDGGHENGVCLSEMCSVPNFDCDGGVGTSDSGSGACGTVSTPCMLCEVQSHSRVPEGGLGIPVADAQPTVDAGINFFGGPDTGPPDTGVQAIDAGSDAARSSAGSSGGCATAPAEGGLAGSGLSAGLSMIAMVALVGVCGRRRRRG